MGEKQGFLPFPKSFDTICIHSSIDPSQWKSNSIIPHIVPSTVFKINDPREPLKFVYSRFGNPNRSILEHTIAAINKGKYGVCFASGISAIMGILGLLKSGEHMICCDDVNPETYEVFNNIGPNYGICTTFLDTSNTDNLLSCIKDNTKLIWVENPTNATQRVQDICSLASIAKEKDVLLGVDNTFLTPYLQRPLELGADVVMQSASKYVNGHSDIIMGCLCTNKQEVFKDLVLMQVEGGLNPSPFECYQTLRGVKTLNLRMDQHLKNATIIANYLGQHSAVEKVIYTGLKSHPEHNLFKLQASGPSGIISFYLKGGAKESEKFIKSLKVFTITEVSGGAESTAEIPYSMSHKNWKKEIKKNLCIPENLIKLSIGLENICDLILDIEAALDFLSEGKKCQ